MSTVQATVVVQVRSMHKCATILRLVAVQHWFTVEISDRSIRVFNAVFKIRTFTVIITQTNDSSCTIINYQQAGL